MKTNKGVAWAFVARPRPLMREMMQGRRNQWFRGDPSPPILTEQLTLFQLGGTDYAYLITTTPPPWIFRPSYGPVMHLGVEYGNQTENRQKFAVFHPYVSFAFRNGWFLHVRWQKARPCLIILILSRFLLIQFFSRQNYY